MEDQEVHMGFPVVQNGSSVKPQRLPIQFPLFSLYHYFVTLFLWLYNLKNKQTPDYVVLHLGFIKDIFSQSKQIIPLLLVLKKPTQKALNIFCRHALNPYLYNYQYSSHLFITASCCDACFPVNHLVYSCSWTSISQFCSPAQYHISLSVLLPCIYLN